MKTLSTSNSGFRDQFSKIINRGAEIAEQVDSTVCTILSDIKKNGDKSLLYYTEKFEHHSRIAVPPEAIKRAVSDVPAETAQSLRRAYDRIEAYHRKQLQQSWIHTDPGGEILGQLVRPIAKAGIYVPGGKAVYPSSVLMNAIPGMVAGVEEIIMVSPGSAEGIDPVILAAADLCGISRIFQIGGAQAIAALAYGTETVPPVDKIVGPGNIYVATAKKMVYGTVDIDMIAGPSEICILSDGTGEPSWVAADMLSQAEHDEMASSILITTDNGFAASVTSELEKQLSQLPKKEIARRALDCYGAVIHAESLDEAASLANAFAPEHLELFVADPWQLLPSIRNAGAVFMGYHTPEPMGDYIAGPNHVLPTGGTARFFSPLGVEDFTKKSSLISLTPQSLARLAPDVIRLARSEDLDAHAASVEWRIRS